jgi:hypothetical protein
MKTADQEDAALSVFPFSFFSSWLWLYVGMLLSLSASRRISDVIVDNGIDDESVDPLIRHISISISFSGVQIVRILI